MYRKTLSMLTAALALSLAAATPYKGNYKLDSAHATQLAGSKTTVDSIAVLYDFFDLADRQHKGAVGADIYNMAQRINRPDIQLDLLRHFGPIYEENDSILQILISEAETFRKTDDARETATYLKMLRAKALNPLLDTETDPSVIVDLLTRIPAVEPRNSKELNERITLLFDIATRLGTTSRGDLQSRVLKELEDYIEDLPLNLPHIRYAFYSLAADLYIKKRDRQNALKADEALQASLDELEKSFRKSGRIHRNLNMGRFYSYRRMMSNFKELPISKVNDLYDKIMHLVEIDPDVAEVYRKDQRSKIYYALAHEDYATAIPLMKNYLREPSNQIFRRLFLQEIIEGAQKTRNFDDLSEAVDLYIEATENKLEKSANDRETDLNILVGMNDLRQQNALLEIENANIENEALKRTRKVFLIVTPLLILLFVVTVGMLLKTRMLTRKLNATNEKLRDQRDKLVSGEQRLIEARDAARDANRQRTEFINNMTHELKTPLAAIADYSRLIADCADPAQKPYLDKYTRLVDMNNDLVQKLINNVLDIGASDTGRMKLNIGPASVRNICNLAIQNARHYLNPGVEMDLVTTEEKDITIQTDSVRLESALIYLLSNAAKFTEQGKVTLEYRGYGDSIVFTVTDTGIGIPAGREEEIFERFFKLDRSTPGAGLGLAVCRVIARLLGGNVVCDATFRGPGARFILTVPVNTPRP